MQHVFNSDTYTTFGHKWQGQDLIFLFLEMVHHAFFIMTGSHSCPTTLYMRGKKIRMMRESNQGEQATQTDPLHDGLLSLRQNKLKRDIFANASLVFPGIRFPVKRKDGSSNIILHKESPIRRIRAGRLPLWLWCPLTWANNYIWHYWKMWELNSLNNFVHGLPGDTIKSFPAELANVTRWQSICSNCNAIFYISLLAINRV